MWSKERTLGLVLEAPFLLEWADTSTSLVEPGRPVTYNPLLRVHHRPVRSFAATSIGECILTFDDQAQLKAKPDERYEAWQTYGEGRLQDAGLLCGPGGGSPWGEGAA
jgi:hypothetical protein